MTDRVISVLTPVHPDAADHLNATAATLLAQQLAPGWRWEWVLQVDGAVAALGPRPPLDDSRLIVRGGRADRAAGPGVTRTMALGSASGELIQVLDADDELTPGALARAVQVFERHPQIEWTTAAALDLLTDGSTRPAPGDPPDGALPPGAVLAHWRSQGHRLPVHPATLCVRRDTLLALGGWMALPASEDTGLLIALDAGAPGWFIGEPGLRHRRWPGQVSAAAAHRDDAERAARHGLIEARAAAITRGRSHPRPPS